MADLQSAALATWLRRRFLNSGRLDSPIEILAFTRYRIKI